MSTDEHIASLHQQLAAQRERLAITLLQVAIHGWAYAPPALISGIAEARREIARLKAALCTAGVEVADAPDDQETAQEQQANAQQQAQTTINTSGGDVAQGNLDKRQGTFFEGNAYILPPRPPIDQAAAQQLLERMPLDRLPVAAPLPPNSRIPAREGFFVGREGELQAIAQALSSGTTTAITTGIGGVGKTTLAIEFAHQYGPYFAGGVFWLSFGEAESIATEIVACGAGLDIPGFAAMKLPEQVAQVRRIWQEPTPRLLIFDNCEDEALLREYRPTIGGCRVLVTSRRGEWSKSLKVATLHLESLVRAESVALLGMYRDDIGQDNADAIAQELGNLPLALSLAGSYLDQYADDAIGEPRVYLGNLRTKLLQHRSLEQNERSVRASFELSYQRLDDTNPIDTLALSALARAAHLAPGEPFPRTLLLSSLGEATEDEDILAQRADAVKHLLALGLLERAQEGALRLHRLIAAFVLRVSTDEAAEAAVENCFINIADNATSWHDTFLQLRGLLTHLRHLAIQASRRGDVRTARLHHILAGCLYYNDEYDSGLDYNFSALSLYRNLGDRLGEANVLRGIGHVLRFRADYSGALQHYRSALSLLQDIGLKLGEAKVLRSIGDVLRLRSDYDDALQYYETALSCFRSIGSKLGEANVLRNIGHILRSRSNYDGALEHYNSALFLFRSIDSKHGEAHVLAALGLIALIRNDQYTADNLLKQAITIYRTIGHRYSIAEIIGDYGWELRRQGRYREAQPYHQQATALFAEIGLHERAEQHQQAAEEFPPEQS